VSTFADHATRAQFAVVGALSKAPQVSGGSSSESGESSVEVTGGPNVVPKSEIPDDATVVDMKAVKFAPKSVTVSVGDTVAFVHSAGEAHTVFAYEDKLPEGASYWASGGFGSESAAKTGWEEKKKGGVVGGQAYVHTFETAGEHGYYCAPHEMAGMVGTVVVEE
ncbi:MAG: plastocyanin/azurin family copper-binding protein, partial [Halobaculum sp.]